MRKLFSIRWISFHLLVIGSLGLFVILGHWQWDVGGTKRGTLRNFAYGAEWWIFGAILIYCWVRLIREELTGTADVKRAKAQAKRDKAPRYRLPAPQVTAQVDDSEDPEMAEYNRYLRALHAQDTGAPAAPERRALTSSASTTASAAAPSTAGSSSAGSSTTTGQAER